jgi:wobble nucleotide-excising tRNase
LKVIAENRGREMFKNIDVLHGAGVLDGYKGTAARLPEFGRYNLIYGWNASGKTTLSRFFRLMEGPNSPRLSPQAYARFSAEQGVLDTLKDQDRAQCHVRVFNSDYVEDNLKQGHTSAPALFIIGSENIRLSERIALLSHQRDRMVRIYSALRRRNEDADKAREKQATAHASACGTSLGIRNFRSPDLKNIAARLADEAAAYLLSEEVLQTEIAAARDQVQYQNLPTTLYAMPQRIPEAGDFASLLSDTPQQQTITRLSQNRELSDWVRTGLHIHQGKTQCEFCGGDATSALAEYARHFSDEYRKQYSAIQDAIHGLEGFLGNVNLPHPNAWIPSLRSRFGDAERRLQQWLQAEEHIRTTWLGQLKDKLDHMETSTLVAPIGERLSDLTKIVDELYALVAEHNRACAEADDVRRKAAEHVKNHFAVRYLLDSDSLASAKILAEASGLLTRAEAMGKSVTAKLTAIQAELQRSSVAATEINGHLQRIMSGRISVEQMADGQLRFMRGETVATNLSDGEKTAVSLAYFLVSLKQNGQQLSNTIVFIDDPICSLDANHIYDVAYLLLDQLKEAKQLFVSSHNSEFFNTIKKEWAWNNGKFNTGAQGYLMHRKQDGSSELVSLPPHLAKFRSDYHHVFYCLQKMRSSTSADIDSYISCPNLLRRFLEMYLGFRKPSAASYETKLDLLIGDEVARKALARFVGEGSHSQSTLRLLEYADFPSMARGMIDRVLKALEEKDPTHYAALAEATSEP